MDAASPNPAPQASASPGPGGAEPGHPFAEVMRSAVSPVQTAKRGSDPRRSSGASHPQVNRASIASGTQPHRVEGSLYKSSDQTPNGNPAKRASNQDGQSANPLGRVTSSSAAPDAVAPSLADRQAQSSIPVTAVEGQSNAVIPQRTCTAAKQAGSSPSQTVRKPSGSVKEVNRSQSASISPTVATAASLTVASVSAIMPNIPVVKLSAAAPTGPSTATASTFRAKAIDAHIVARDAPPTNSVAASGVPTNDKHGAISNPATAENTMATSAANQNSGHDGIGAGQQATVTDGTSAQAFTNRISNLSVDANTSNAASTAGAGNSAAAAKDPTGTAGDRAGTSIHGSEASKSSSFIAAIPTLATAAKDLPSPHTNPADSGVRLHDSSSVFAAGSNSGATGSSFQSKPSSTPVQTTTADAFTALDSAAASERGVLLHAAPHQVAVGVSDPSLGWVEVRAERVSGQIAAALTTNSAASHAALTSVLPTMATYLQEHHSGVHQVHVETSLAGRQAGTGSQGQASSQNQGHTAPDQLTVANAATNSWNAVPVVSAALATGQRNNSIHEGHHFSIRA